jgi:hypothetical protein
MGWRRGFDGNPSISKEYYGADCADRPEISAKPTFLQTSSGQGLEKVESNAIFVTTAKRFYQPARHLMIRRLQLAS